MPLDTLIPGPDRRVPPPSAVPAWRIDRDGSGAVLTLSGDWLVRESGLRPARDIQAVVAAVSQSASLRFETGGLARWDSALVAFVRAIDVSADDLDLDLSGLPEALRRLLALARSNPHANAGGREPWPSALWRVGHRALNAWAQLTTASGLIGITVLSIPLPWRKRARVHSLDLISLMTEAGPRALGIITIVNGLVGAILAFVGAVQLQRFGASIFVADLVGVAVIREMAAVMTAIVMAGRTGGAYAAQIADMQENEEIDALRTFGIPLGQYLVVPRVTALVAMMPLLYFYACLVGVGGGLLTGAILLGIAPSVFLAELATAVTPVQFVIGLAKSTCFGAFIALAACRIGLGAGRGATEVGRAATNAVVTGIIGIIALDAIFAICANALGI